MSLKKDELKYLINTCLSLELYEEAYDYSKQLKIVCDNTFDEDERNLYMKCLKGKLNIERNAWKILIDFENYEQDKEILPKKLMKEKKDYLEEERKKLCFEVVEDCKIFEQNVEEDDYPAQIFYLKLKADYLRYYGEVATEEEFEKYKKTCKDSYEKAYELCKDHLEPTSPLYLSVALNYSVFLYTLTDKTSEAYNIANETYKQAILKLLPEKKIPEVESILKSIEENITIWRIEISEYNN
jgi:14-3-3 protein epsilon